MRKKQIDREIILLLTTTLVTVAVWIGFEVYRAYTKVALPEGLEQYLTPIDTVLSTGVLEKLEMRI